MEAARQAVALDPDEPLGYHLLALCHSGKKNHKAALKICEQGLARTPGSALLTAQCAENQLELRGVAKAEPIVEDALRLGPDSIYVLRIAARIALAGGQLERAKSLLSTVLRRNANDETAISLFLLADTNKPWIVRQTFTFNYWRRARPVVGALVHGAAIFGLIVIMVALTFITRAAIFVVVIGLGCGCSCSRSTRPIARR